MRIHAYQEMYVSRVQGILGEALDYAVNVCGLAGDVFLPMFTASMVATRLERGDYSYLLGKSGIDIVYDVLLETTKEAPALLPYAPSSRSVAYWCGWAMAYYQWYSDRPYGQLFGAVDFGQLEDLYHPLHEADISKFVEAMDALVAAHFSTTNLKRLRGIYGYTQAQLSDRSGVSLRSIQMYEQRQEDINKASAITVYQLSKALGCSVEDLLEK